MRLSLRAVIGLTAVAVLSLGTAQSNGFYNRVALAAALGAVVLAVVAEAVRGRSVRLDSPESAGGREVGLMALAVAVVAAGFLAPWGDEWVRANYEPDKTPWFDPAAVRLTVAASVALLVALALGYPRARFGSFELIWAAAVAALLTGQGVRYARVLYPDGPAWACTVIWALALLGFVGVVLLTLFGAGRGKGVTWCLAALLLLTGVGQRAFGVVASPHPVIDVYPLLTEGAEHLLAGRNIYSQDYTDPYADPVSDAYGLYLHDGGPAGNPDPDRQPVPRPAGYPPLPFLATAPFRAVGLDVRMALVVADGLAALVLFLAGRRRGSPLAGLLLATTYLHLPRSALIVEQTWYEPLLAALLGGGLYLSEVPGRVAFIGHVLLSLGLTGKQYGLPLLVPALAAFRLDGGWRKLLLALAVVVLVTIAPFALWAPWDFKSIVLDKHVAKPPQAGALTLTQGYIDLREWYHLWVLDQDWGGDDEKYEAWRRTITPPKRVMQGLAVLLILAVSTLTPARPTAAALTMGTVLTVFSLCYTQGYMNYFYLTSYLWLLGVAGGWEPDEPRQETDQRP